jgi:transposase
MRQLRKGRSCRAVAKTLGVSKSTVSRWRKGGRCKPSGHHEATGRPRKLSTKQQEKLKAVLLKGAYERGYESDHWTLKRIADVIEREFGVTYETSAVWHVMKRMGWSCQKPQLRTVQRDEAEIERWRRYVFPQLKKRTALRSQDDFLG